MPLFIISIPLMVLAVAVAAIPLIVMSHHEQHRHAAERAATSPAPSAGRGADVAEEYSVAA